MAGAVVFDLEPATEPAGAFAQPPSRRLGSGDAEPEELLLHSSDCNGVC